MKQNLTYDSPTIILSKKQDSFNETVLRKGVYMKVQIDVEENGSVIRSAEDEVSADETIENIAKRFAPKLDIGADELMEELRANGVAFEKGMLAGDCVSHGHRWRHQRVCIDLHFESEHLVHHFSPSNRWAQVHRFGCHRFEIPKDACANLELRKGSPDGPALNENSKIGPLSACEVVWLVKPGPEPNGGYIDAHIGS
jgi:hypothetical protein